MTAETPALAHLMTCYVHQDWFDAGSEDDAIDLFLHDNPHLAALVTDEVELVLVHDDEAAAEKRVRSIGSDYDPRRVFGGYRSFLERIAERARVRTA